MTDPIPLRTGQPATPFAALRCPNMLAIASGKGGVGKTWFAITLSHALAKRGKRVLLFDGDLGLANVDIQLGLTPERDLGNVIDGHMKLQAAVTRYEEGKFDILAGRSGSGSLATLPTQKLADLRNDLIALARNYDYVFVDLGAGVDRAVRQMAGPAAITYVVVTDEPTSLTDAYAFIKLSHAANPLADLRVVVNLANNAQEGRKTYDALRKVCKSFLQITPQLAGIIRRDNKVREAIRTQTPLLTRSPVSDAASDVGDIASNILNG
ncbi:MAG: MinD/ParA family protein [Alphaproteobacteria bacterium]|nr:MinD/ParA family protein [Alphaproteobacteria bacterium]